MTAGKPEYPPLFTAGFLEISDADLDHLFVSPFQQAARRAYLVERLRALLAWLGAAVHIEWEIWLNGSFCTQKEEPDDIDIAFFYRAEQVDALGSAEARLLEALADYSGQDQIRLRFDCDCYFLAREDEETRSYWRGWFGFTREEIPKGIPRLWLNRIP